MDVPCYALLDDASDNAGGPARSRLYTGHVGTLVCSDVRTWPALLAQMEQALRDGRHAVALFQYELGAQLLRPGGAAGDATLAQVLLFETCEHLEPDAVAAWLVKQTAADTAPAGVAGVRANVDQAGFDAALASIHAYIAAGDAYQVNYTYRLHFDTYGSAAALYTRLRARQPVPYGALIALPDGGAVLSLSPELFVRHTRGALTARPMKGTAPAAGSVDDDTQRAAALAADPKNRAENLMIVDLLRNDMGRVAVTGTVQVPQLFEVKRYGSVLQMTSTVAATLRPEARLANIVAALYPCGSITGAPKRRSMEIIAELEPAARGLYTGAIGWFAAPEDEQAIGDFCLSVPIRTLVLAAPQNGVRAGLMGVGAGIVHDSETAAEYAECQLKARFLTGLEQPFGLFETMHASRTGGIRHRSRHLQRLAASARYFGVPFAAAGLNQALDAACAALAGDGPHRLRLELRQRGGDGNDGDNNGGPFAIGSAPLTPISEPVGLLLSTAATDAGDLFLRHKTTHRAAYDAAWRDAEAHGAFDTLFVNQRGELTEGGRSNVFVQLDGRWYTPPLSSGALPGVMRGVLLDDPAWAATERVLTPAMLAAADAIVVCNALRGPLRAVLRGQTLWGQTPADQQPGV